MTTPKPRGRPPGTPNPNGGRKLSGRRNRTLYLTDFEWEKVRQFAKNLKTSA